VVPYKPTKDSRDWTSAKDDFIKLAYIPVKPFKPRDEIIETGPFEGSSEYNKAFPPKKSQYVRAKPPVTRNYKEPSPPFDGQSMNSKFFPTRAFVPRSPSFKPKEKEWEPTKGDFTTMNSKFFVPKKAIPSKPKIRADTFRPTKDDRDWKTDGNENFVPHKAVRIMPIRPISRKVESGPFEGQSESQRSFVPKKGSYVRAQRPITKREADLPFEGTTSNMANFKIRWAEQCNIQGIFRGVGGEWGWCVSAVCVSGGV
jgi:hypothetical protein